MAGEPITLGSEQEALDALLPHFESLHYIPLAKRVDVHLKTYRQTLKVFSTKVGKSEPWLCF